MDLLIPEVSFLYPEKEDFSMPAKKTKCGKKAAKKKAAKKTKKEEVPPAEEEVSEEIETGEEASEEF